MRKKNNLNQKVAESVRQKIVSGELQPGDRLPGEYELADQFQVSRFTVREAMMQLASIGLIEIRHGVGMFVSKLSPLSHIKLLFPIIALTSQDIKTICEVRLPIEIQSISLCVKRAVPEDIWELKEIYSSMIDALEKEDYDHYTELDFDFHLCIARISDNPILYEMLNMLHEFLHVQMKEMLATPNSAERSITKHQRMIEAIEQRDSVLAELIMSRHINDSIDYVTKESQTF
ncbi:MAG: FadR/GntR family transcriptional regulator [Saccharofermentanales bacterium]